MYQAFDRFLKSASWFTSHASEDRTFYECLSTVVDDPSFDPQKMGEHMKKTVGPDDEEGMYYQAIDHRVTEAYAIRDFLRQTRR